jgi:RimJ/RimL family protein N-acetyltransferase
MAWLIAYDLLKWDSLIFPLPRKEFKPMPAPLFETPRAVIYPFTLDDFDYLKALHQHPDIYVTTGTGFSDDTRVQNELEEYMEEYQRLGISQLKVISKTEISQFMGRVGLQFRKFHPDFTPDYEVRISLIPNFWGCGLATELLHATLNYSFNHLQLNRIIIGHYQSNLKSKTIANKLGFQQISWQETPKEPIINYELFKADYFANKEMTH